MDTFRRCLSPGKTQGRFVRLIPGYGSLHSINGEIELFLGCNLEQFRACMPVSLHVSVNVCLNRSYRKTKTIYVSPTYILYVR